MLAISVDGLEIESVEVEPHAMVSFLRFMPDEVSERTRVRRIVLQPGDLHQPRFVHVAARFHSQVRVARDAKVMDGKSIMGILLLAAARGSTLTISADGADEEVAVEALVDLVQSGFGEPTWNA